MFPAAVGCCCGALSTLPEETQREPEKKEEITENSGNIAKPRPRRARELTLSN